MKYGFRKEESNIRQRKLFAFFPTRVNVKKGSKETMVVWLQFYYIEEEFGHTVYSDWGWNKKEVYGTN